MRAFQSAACRTVWCVLLVDALLVLSRLGRCLLSFLVLTGLLCLQRLMRPRHLAQGKSRHQFINTTHCTPTPAPTPTRRHSNTKHRHRHRTQNTKQNTRHKSQDTRHKTQDTRHKTQDTQQDTTRHDTNATHKKHTHTHTRTTNNRP